MVSTTTKNRDERVETVADLVEICTRITEALSNAESCETDSDLDANVVDAIDAAEELIKLAKTTWKVHT